MTDVLLSYRTEERATAETLARQLADEGFSIDLASRFAGEKPTIHLADPNEKEIDDATCVLTLWSRASPNADYMLIEAQRSASQHKLVVADLQNVALPLPLQGQPLIDVSNWLLTRDATELRPLAAQIKSILEAARQAAQSFAPDVYLAYRRTDTSDAEAVVLALEAAGYSVWWDRKIPPGALWMPAIGRSFGRARLFLLVATHDGLKSKFIAYYASMALKREIPVLIAEFEKINPEEYEFDLGRELRLGLWDWRANHGQVELERLCRTIRAMIGQPNSLKSPAPSPPPKAQGGALQRAGSDVFISYKREDRPKVAPYVKRLTDSGLKIWWDVLIEKGANWGLAIERALKDCRSVAVFWTPLSVVSEEVYDEANYGMRIGALFPTLLEACDVPIRMTRVQYADLTRGDFDEFDQLINSLKHVLAAP